jgi:tRNA (guanine37-N1)-methyltransferase
MFCGIGPLSIKSAVKKKGLRVICNDLNPEAINYCNQNIIMNKVQNRVNAFNMDAREFMKLIIEQSN